MESAGSHTGSEFDSVQIIGHAEQIVNTSDPQDIILDAELMDSRRGLSLS